MGSVAGGLAGVFTYSPETLRRLMNAQLRMRCWTLLAATAFVSYRVGHWAGTMAFGNSQAAHNHNVAYIYQKTLNRYEGRQILHKPPKFY
jgi:hypothetical protein